MKVLLIAATVFEIAPILSAMDAGNCTPVHEVEPLITGVGMQATAYALGRRLAVQTPDWVVQAGVAGALDPELALGSVVQVWSETFADLGVEHADGSASDLFDLELIQPDSEPFRQGRLWNDAAERYPFLRAVHGLTVNRVTGSARSVEAIRTRYPYGQIETMEGAAALYACLLSGVPCTQVRAISNRVEPRNRDAWQLKEAISALNDVLQQML